MKVDESLRDWAKTGHFMKMHVYMEPSFSGLLAKFQGIFEKAKNFKQKELPGINDINNGWTTYKYH